MSAVDNARGLAAQGLVELAEGELVRAGVKGDAEALMQHAVWLLIGQPLPRDLPRARHLLRAAVAIGHVDGALLEIALTANGSGGLPDWAGAVRLLVAAAHNDHVAATHLALIREMDIDSSGLPQKCPTVEILCPAPRILRARSLFTPAECAHVASLASDVLEPASVIDPRTGQRIPHAIRTSDNATIGPARESLVVRALNVRVAMISGTLIEQGEPLTVLRYRPGQEYRLHLDTIDGARNQRIRTVLIYLNHGYPGGETDFPAVPLRVVPSGGDAIIFDTVAEDGRPDPRARHAGLPVLSGQKWLATRWIRASPVDGWSIGQN